MTDFTREWIAKREQLDQAAAPGPWHWEPPSGDEWPTYDESLATEDGEAVLLGWGYDASGIEGAPADREFIADARTALPAALAALKAVLGATEYKTGHYGHAPLDGDDCAACLAADVRAAVEAALRGES